MRLPLQLERIPGAAARLGNEPSTARRSSGELRPSCPQPARLSLGSLLVLGGAVPGRRLHVASTGVRGRLTGEAWERAPPFACDAEVRLPVFTAETRLRLVSTACTAITIILDRPGNAEDVKCEEESHAKIGTIQEV